MALQHLFTRVPAKISMYNRADSYDTFARSENLEREFVEKELNTYSDIKLTMQESGRLRTEGLEPLYMCRPSKDGESYIESCVSFSPLDFTGERSAYFIHNLILGNEEASEIFAKNGVNFCDAVNFEHSADKYNITSPDASPIKDLPEINLAQNSCKTEALERVGDKVTMQRFVYCMLAAACGKIKGLYFTLGDPDNVASGKALEFYNAFLQILPVHVRRALSFMSRCSDAGKFTGIKVKCVSSECGAIPSSKGIAIKLDAVNQFSGFKDEDVAINFRLVDFIYSLIARTDIRTEFVDFSYRVTKAIPAMATLNLQTLGDLALLFMVCSGFYSEETTLPNDNVMDEFYTIYEKARKGLTDQERINALKSLARYPQEHREISKTVFSKLSKIYSTEPPCTKVIIMDTVLKLIHTDVMREKLFRFIKDKYQGEEENVREKVNEDLCRVYYGGFLMPQILAFFGENFKDEPESVKTTILDKVLLTIRTKGIVEQVRAFLAENYQYLDTHCKARFYKGVIDNVKEGDEISADYLTLVDEKIAGEDLQLKGAVKEYVVRNLRAEATKREKPFVSLLAVSEGWTSGVLSELIFGEWFRTAAYREYIRNMCDTPMDSSVSRIFRVLNEGSLGMDKTAKFAEDCATAFSEATIKRDVIKLLAADELLKTEISSENRFAAAFAEGISTKLMPYLMSGAATTMFNHPEMPGLAEKLVAYGKEHGEFSESPEVLPIALYLRLKHSIGQGDAPAAFANAVELCKAVPAKKLSIYLNADLAESKTPLLMLITQYLETETIDLAACYGEFAPEAAIDEALAVKILGYVNALALADGQKGQPVFAPETVNADRMLGAIYETDIKQAKKFFKTSLKTLQPLCPAYNSVYVKMSDEVQGKKSFNLFKRG